MLSRNLPAGCIRLRFMRKGFHIHMDVSVLSPCPLHTLGLNILANRLNNERRLVLWRYSSSLAHSFWLPHRGGCAVDRRNVTTVMQCVQ